MKRQRRGWIAVGLLALLASVARSQDVPIQELDRSQRVTFASLEALQEPRSVTSPSVPVTPLPPRPITTVPPVPGPTATTTTPLPPTPSSASTALAVPPPPPIPSSAATTGMIGSELFNQQGSAIQTLAGTRPSRTVEFLGDFFAGTRLAALAQGLPPIPNPPPPLPNPNPPPGPGQGGNGNGVLRRGAILVPSVRGFKIAENQTPRPIDRIYYFTNYFNNVNQQVNREFHSPISSIMAYRHTIGFEKTFMDGRASFGAQLPINTLSVSERNSRVGGTTTAVGDLSFITKYAFLTDQETGSLLSGGLAVTIPTGPSSFAGNRTVTNLHFTGLSPYVGYIWSRDRFFFQGFNSLNVPTSSRDVTYLFNDLGIGYYAYQNDDPNKWLTALVPTFEVHVNTPLNHRGGYLKDPAGTPDVVDLTYGLNAFIYEKTKTSVGFVTPVTGPRPFSFEVLANVTIRF